MGHSEQARRLAHVMRVLGLLFEHLPLFQASPRWLAAAMRARPADDASLRTVVLAVAQLELVLALALHLAPGSARHGQLRFDGALQIFSPVQARVFGVDAAGGLPLAGDPARGPPAACCDLRTSPAPGTPRA